MMILIGLVAMLAGILRAMLGIGGGVLVIPLFTNLFGIPSKLRSAPASSVKAGSIRLLRSLQLTHHLCVPSIK